MNTNDIEKDVTYLSIHDVPYLVVGIDAENNVRARCMAGRSKDFLISMERFAAAMKQARH